MLDAASTGETAIAALTGRLAAGDEAAFREFHAAYFPRLFRYLIVCARGDEEAARDALQETTPRRMRGGAGRKSGVTESVAENKPPACRKARR